MDNNSLMSKQKQPNNKWFLNFIEGFSVLKTSASTHRSEEEFFPVLFSSFAH